jgi:quinohemoprotein ethanol dehydrogenase
MRVMSLSVAVLLLSIALASCGKKESSTSVAPPIPTASQGDVDFTRLKKSTQTGDDWLVNGRDIGGTYFSPLSAINKSNVGQLGFAWDYKLGTRRGLEATPIVVDGVMYAVGNFGHVYTVAADTGRELWTYDPNIDGQYGRYACCDAVNRGLVVWKGKVYVGALDGFLHAIDAKTGAVVWKTDTLIDRAAHRPYTLTGAPVIAGNVIVIGNAGADFKGARGYVSAYDLDSGVLKWRFFTVPQDPKLGPQDQPHLVVAAKTWDPRHRWEFGGGGTVWDGMSYDPDLDLLYIGTANASPYTLKDDGRRGGDDLYAASIVAIHAKSGEMAWYYQVVPQDQWDFDSTQKMILTDLTIADVSRKVLLQASKNGFFYVLDRTTGEFISAKNFAYFNWTKGLDPKTGRPSPSAAAEYVNAPKVIFPSAAGAHSWQPMSFDPETGLVYIPVAEAAMVYIETQKRPAGLIEGNFTVAGIFPQDYDPKALAPLFGSLPSKSALMHGTPPSLNKAISVLKAWDPVKQQLVWERPSGAFWHGGVMSTAGGLVVQGNAAGMLSIFDAATGEVLKMIDVGTGMMAAPMTYRVHGEQYIAVMAGYGGATGLYSPFPPDSAPYKYANDGRIVAFKMGGGPVPKPDLVTDAPFSEPPPREGKATDIAHGEILYNRFCSRCHTMGRSVLPDLRRLSPATHTLFYQIVLEGIYAPQGMGRWDDVLSRKDAEDLHAFLIDQSWQAYTQQTAAH